MKCHASKRVCQGLERSVPSHTRIAHVFFLTFFQIFVKNRKLRQILCIGSLTFPKEYYLTKKIEDLTFIDNGMFQAVMHEPGISEKVIEDLLHVKVGKIVYPKLEKQIAPFYTSKGVRLDVYLKDENKVIDVEIQTYKQDAIGKRTRYYQSLSQNY